MTSISRYYPDFQKDLDAADSLYMKGFKEQALEKLKEIDRRIGSIYPKSRFRAQLSQCVKNLFGYVSPDSEGWGAKIRAVCTGILSPRKNLAASAAIFSEICESYKILASHHALRYLKTRHMPLHRTRMDESMKVDSPNLIQVAIEERSEAVSGAASEWASLNPDWVALGVTLVPTALYFSSRKVLIMLAGTGFAAAATVAWAAHKAYQMMGDSAEDLAEAPRAFLPADSALRDRRSRLEH